MVPPGKDIPTPLGEQEMSREAFYLARRRSKQLLHIIPTLMLSCCMMLVNPYPAQVSVPINSLLALVERVLKVDGSLSQSPLPSTAAMQQEFICSELPALHLASLDLLEAIIRGVRSQLLPHAAEIIGLLKEYFKRCVLPGLRVKIYMIVRIFLLTQGIGVALHIGEEVISNAFIDLDVIGCGSGVESSSAHSKITTEALPQLSCKKRKRVDVTRNLEEHPEGVGLEVQVPENNSTSPTPLKIAALEALETLLTVGGAMRSNCLQSNIELLLINVATNAFDGELDNEEDKIFAAMFQCNSVDLQIAALRALLACLLLPVRLRPCHLAKGLELFRKGKRERETRLAAFCAHALLALENRGQTGFFSITEIAYAEPSSHGEGFNHNFSENVHTSGQEGNILPLSTPQSSDIPDSGDNPCDNWLGNDDIIKVPPTHPDENTGNAGEFSETNIQQAAEDLLAENIPRDGLLGEIPGDSNQEQALIIEMESGKSKDVIVLEPHQYPNPISIKGVKEVSQDTDRGLETIPVEAEGGMTRPDNEASLHYIPEVEAENPDSC
uniref:Proline-, glutamic acid-and leucine-rich protein 1 n=1 Tax=Vitis vinifera TaxID=29760 RepID=F6H5R6_VITVI